MRHDAELSQPAAPVFQGPVRSAHRRSALIRGAQSKSRPIGDGRFSPPFMCAHVVVLEGGGDDEWVATFGVLLTSGDR